MQGASPLASPRLSRKRHGLNLRDKYPEGARPLCCLLTLPVACFLAPSPRPPSPPGKGEIFSFLMQGASPLSSPRLSRKRHGLNLRDKCPEGACPLGRLPTLPLALLLPPSPDPLPCGKGETISLFCRGLRPLHPGVWTGRGTGSASIGDTRRGARVLVAGSPCHRYTRRGGANKAGTLKIHRAADRRQAAGRSSRAEYSEVPGIVGPLSGSDGSFFVILPDRRSSFCGEKRPPGRPGQAPQSHRRWCCRIRTCYPFRR